MKQVCAGKIGFYAFFRLGNSTVNISQMKWARVLATGVWHIWTGNTAGSVNVNVECKASSTSAESCTDVLSCLEDSYSITGI